VVRFGRGFARAQYTLSLAVALVVPLAFWRLGHDAGCLLPLVLTPLAWRLARRLAVARTPAELIALLGATGQFVALYAALFAVGVVL